ncbi:hypothetical protein ACFL6Y_00160 [Elusimicrobiota bacterium]
MMRRWSDEEMRRKSNNSIALPLFFFIAVALCLCIAPSSSVWCADVSTSTAAFKYTGLNYRDPFINLSKGGYRLAAANSKKKMTIAEVESKFDPTALKLQAVIGGANKDYSVALLTNPVNGEQFVIKKGKIQHASSRLWLENYKAKVHDKEVVITKTKGEPLMIIVNYEKKGKK